MTKKKSSHKKSTPPTWDDMDCRIMTVPEDELIPAMKIACAENPANAPLLAMVTGIVWEPQKIAVVTQKYWGSEGVKLTVGFPWDNPAPSFQKTILAYLNRWNTNQFKKANIVFVLASDPLVRLGLDPLDGHWSYLGTDLRYLHPQKNKKTMNLAINPNTPERELLRVLPHEAGHAAGCPHEHSRAEIIELLDKLKTIKVFRNKYGWDEKTTLSQVFIVQSEFSIRGTPHAKQDSVMCYSFSGECTKSGQPIVGGTDITKDDAEFMAGLYPMAIEPKPPEPPPEPPKPPTGGKSVFQKIINLINALKSGDMNAIWQAILAFFSSDAPAGAAAALGAPEAPRGTLSKDECSMYAANLEALTSGVPGGAEALPSGLFLKFLPILMEILKKLLG